MRFSAAPDVGLVASGMLVYTAIVSPGYFAQQGTWAFVALFAVILLLTVTSVLQLSARRAQLPTRKR